MVLKFAPPAGRTWSSSGHVTQLELVVVFSIQSAGHLRMRRCERFCPTFWQCVNLDDHEDFTKETGDENEVKIASAHEHDSDWVP